MTDRRPDAPAGSRQWAHPIRELTLMRLREFMREPEAVFWALIFPILVTTGLGVAFRNQAGDQLAVVASTAQLAAALRHDPQLSVAELPPDDAERALLTGRAVLAAEAGPDGRVVYRYDDTNPDGRLARMHADRAVQIAGGRTDPVPVGDRVVHDTGSRYIDFLVPGLVGMGVMGNAIWGLGFAIVDARRRNLMKRIVATPMRRSDFLLSFLLWRLLLLVFEVSIPVGFGVIAFGVPIRGSIVELVAICVLGSLAFSALGLLIASRARTIEGVSGIMNLVMMPMWIVSGVFFSAQRFPQVMQPLIRILPLTAMNDALRANMLQGAGLGDVAPQLAVLAGCLVVSFSLALRFFRWR